MARRRYFEANSLFPGGTKGIALTGAVCITLSDVERGAHLFQCTIYANAIQYDISEPPESRVAEEELILRQRSFWTLTGNPTLLSTPELLRLAERSGMTPEQAVYKLCQT